MKKYAIILAVMLFAACPGGNVAEEYKLPEPLRTNRSIEECLAARRSVRGFASDTLTTEQIATLLWAAQGITDTARGFRTAPSAGATYPLETYLVTHQGIFLYHPAAHKITLVKKGDKRAELALACLGQYWVGKAPASIVLCAVPERTSQRYGERAMRYIWMEAGHAAQNILLEAVALDLGGVPIGAFSDDAVSKLLDLDKAEDKTIPLYVLSVGTPKR
ncbi:MAG: SagB/ThcOx family dehydrogenase [Candidatus Stahlbacteria bacterium]|nr:MAG: SagB/ThcOx family dehydrogenase [Candidatus Stahlbacteria bacterium]